MGLICDICGLPTVPFGGEDVCLSTAHARGYEDGEDPGDDDEPEDWEAE